MISEIIDVSIDNLKHIHTSISFMLNGALVLHALEMKREVVFPVFWAKLPMSYATF